MMPFRYENNQLCLLDQRLLPHEEKWIEQKNSHDLIESIKNMTVRGAPLIGFTGLFALAFWFKDQLKPTVDGYKEICQLIKSARPTAVNLMFEIDRIYPSILKKINSLSHMELYQEVMKDCFAQIDILNQKNTHMAHTGVDDLKKIYGSKKLNLMTHCNTGMLACGCTGTALGVISYAHDQNLVNHVWVDETRPYLQGSRLTAFELEKENIPFQVVVEGAAHYLMSQKKVDAIFVGADRIAANGDTANKVGTANLALIAHHYKIPFYVVAPLSSFDFSLKDGSAIHIELRDDKEILNYKEHRIASHKAQAFNPSFDITPGHLIHGIICEKGLITNPSIEKLKVWHV
jgi:methylthioribose-1-phosphate isomerase